MSLLPISYALFLLQATSPDTAGIYLTAADFEHHHLTCSVPSKQLRYDSPFRPWALLLRTTTGQQKRFLADTIYGFRKAGQDFRFIGANNKGNLRIDDNFYKIETTVPLCIYSYHYIHSSTQLLFSLTPTSVLLRLNAENLAKYFPSQPTLAQEVNHDKKLRYNMAARDEDGQLRVAKIMAKYLPAPAK